MRMAPAGPIQIRPGEAERLIVLFPYAAERVAKIKTVAGRRWHQGKKYWTVPHHDGALVHLLALFAGEPVEVEPSLRSVRIPVQCERLHQPVVPYPELLDQVRQAIRTRHYSYRTEEVSSDGSAASSCFMTSVIRLRWGPQRSPGF